MSYRLRKEHDSFRFPVLCLSLSPMRLCSDQRNAGRNLRHLDGQLLKETGSADASVLKPGVPSHAVDCVRRLPPHAE